MSNINSILEQLYGNKTYQNNSFFYDWAHNEGKYVLSLDVPGFAKEEISVKTKENKLTVKVSPTAKNKRQGLDATFIVPKNVDFAKVSAELTNGILDVHLPEKDSPENKENFVKIT